MKHLRQSRRIACTTAVLTIMLQGHTGQSAASLRQPACHAICCARRAIDPPRAL